MDKILDYHGIALRLEKELGIDAEFWIGLQTQCELSIERGKLKKIRL